MEITQAMKEDTVNKEENAAIPSDADGGSLETIIASLRESFDTEEAIRAKVVLLRDKAGEAMRKAQRLLSSIHINDDVISAAATVEAALPAAGEALAAVEGAVPAHEYFRHSDLWRRITQDIVCACVVVRFIRTNELANPDAVRKLLSAPSLRLPLDDYLMGVIGAVSELARLCMTRATAGDFETPPRCSSFASLVFEGFKLLNFRNDFLRKRFDGMKYDVKRIEEIMYDLAVRGLLKKKSGSDEDADVGPTDVNMQETQSGVPAKSK